MDQINLLNEANHVNAHNFIQRRFDLTVCWSQSVVILGALIHFAPGIVSLGGRRLGRLPGHGASNGLSSYFVDSRD
jgi:hypothetical protein